jgi:hypothetical protein
MRNYAYLLKQIVNELLNKRKEIKAMRVDIAALQASQVALAAAVSAVQAKIVALPILEGDDIQALTDIKTGVDAATAALGGIAG